jgi:hypothetical protein
MSAGDTLLVSKRMARMAALRANVESTHAKKRTG